VIAILPKLRVAGSASLPQTTPGAIQSSAANAARNKKPGSDAQR
jgi:hypothetical protein